jgi:hypothetical protein
MKKYSIIFKQLKKVCIWNKLYTDMGWKTTNSCYIDGDDDYHYKCEEGNCDILKKLK